MDRPEERHSPWRWDFQVAALPDPVELLEERRTLENGLVIQKKRVASSHWDYSESRPNVTSDAAALALKAGVLLFRAVARMPIRTAHAIVSALKTGAGGTAIDPAVLQLVEDTSRESSWSHEGQGGFRPSHPTWGSWLDPGSCKVSNCPCD